VFESSVVLELADDAAQSEATLAQSSSRATHRVRSGARGLGASPRHASREETGAEHREQPKQE
jgi:hypothetical protein